MVAYLCAVNNPNDDLRLSRIINNPPRGIGATTIDRAQDLALQTGRSLWEIVKRAREFPELQKAAPKLGQFTEMMEDLRRLSPVSYTHLDVYKRQAQSQRQPASCRLSFTQENGSGSITRRRRQTFHGASGSEWRNLTYASF